MSISVETLALAKKMANLTYDSAVAAGYTGSREDFGKDLFETMQGGGGSPITEEVIAEWGFTKNKGDVTSEEVEDISDIEDPDFKDSLYELQNRVAALEKGGLQYASMAVDTFFGDYELIKEG